ncbi:hypothetical protein B0J11DRAFT_440122 [Dendryphion nanum]|uniref:Glycosyltransferase family 31 protein n=1 Tax=Dendryphion nanum TaxID=256645 RepID=A0A9P9DID2_9PLEO|nr:hypothetical protein B0J11DRAFT_440122 [Dendryphion nanum]
MPHFTPSRIAVVVLTFSLLTFLWTFGLPNPGISPALPKDQHDTSSQNPAKGKDGHKDNLKVPTSPPTPTPTPASTPSSTPSPSAKPDEMEKVKDVGELKNGQTTAPGESLKEQKETASGTAAKVQPTSIPASSAASVVESSLEPTPSPSATGGPEFCKHVHRAPDVMIVIKTSKAEIKEKIPSHLKTLLSCVPNFAIFSDHAGEIDGIPIYDVLESVSESAKQQHGEFKDYERIKTEDNVKAGSVNKDLDKWKILPMVYTAYQMRPEARFYMFIEADTSLSWANLLQWIDRLDYRIAYYSGAPNTLGKIRFAQRGSGILLSQGALRLYAKGYDELYKSKWEGRVGNECCGDAILATAMQDSRVEFYSSFPLIQGESPWTLDWTNRHWCAPMLTWHHVNKQDLETIWEQHHSWTAKNGWDKPYLFRDAFTELIEPHLTDLKHDWDNISADSKIEKNINAEKDPNSEWSKHSEELKKSIESPENCKKICEISEDCVQWKHSTNGNGECYVGKVIRYGRKAESKEGDAKWTSGWMIERIKAQKTKWECKEPKWKFGQ